VPVTTSTYVQNSFQMKHFMSVGAVTGYAEEVTRSLITDLRAKEISGSTQGQYWDIEWEVVWGSAGATQYGPYPQFDGLDNLVSTYSGSNQNAINKAGAALTLATLDELADMVESNAAMDVFHSGWMYVMSNTMVSKMSQLLVNQQRFVDQVEIAAGLIVPSYRGIPLVKTSFLSSRNYQMGTVTGSATTVGGLTGTIANSSVTYYAVSAVIARQGEIAASPQVTVTAAGSGGPFVNKLSFTAPNGLDGLAPMLYKVYSGTSSGQLSLLGIVDATVGLDANGNPVATTSIIDTGTTLIPANGSTLPGTANSAYVGTNASKTPPLLSGNNSNNGNTESIYLVSRDENYLCRPWVREIQPLDIYPTTGSPDTLPFAIVTDTTLALRGPKFIGVSTGVGAYL
jgi:hypothetical protein